MIVEINDEQRKLDAGSTAPGNAYQVLLSKMFFEPGRESPNSLGPGMAAPKRLKSKHNPKQHKPLQPKS